MGRATGSGWSDKPARGGEIIGTYANTICLARLLTRKR